MVSDINSTADDSIQLMMAHMYQKLNKADTDGTAGLSKSELSSIDADNKTGAAFLKSLQEQFDALDKDGDKQLSSNEIASLKPNNPLSTQDVSSLASSAGESLGRLTTSFVQKLLDSYKNGGLSSLASSINIAG